MSTGTWALSVYALVGFLAFILALLGFSILTEWRAIIGAIGILPAVFVTAYKGVMLSNTAQPGWKDARWLGGEFALSSGANGRGGIAVNFARANRSKCYCRISAGIDNVSCNRTIFQTFACIAFFRQS